MSVLIKGMEMPTSCADCPIGDELRCSLMPGVPALWKEYTLALKTNRRHEECPLVPVPPHGRLIDADALEKEHMKRAYENFRSYQFHVSATAWINEAPTVIQAEEGKP